MGNVLTDQCTNRSHFQSVNEVVSEHDDYHLNGFKEVHALVVYVDYGFEPAKSQGWCPAGFGPKLDTQENAETIKALLKATGCQSITEISNLEATREKVLSAIDHTASKCKGDDIFFFFYSGHGTQIKDQDGDEEDGMDEAMCLPSADGSCNAQTWLRDDDFALKVASVRCGAKIFVLDCCHSGTLLDFSRSIWQNQVAVSLSGCRDAQEAAAMGGGSRGGAFTKCLNKATHTLTDDTYSVGKLFNTAMKYRGEFVPRKHVQNMTIQCPAGMDPTRVPWPLARCRSNLQTAASGQATPGLKAWSANGDVIMAKADLAKKIRENGDLAEAERLQRQVLEEMMEILGPTHPYTLSAKVGLANTLWHRGDLAKSERLQREATEAMMVILGPKHPDYLIAKTNLVNIQHAHSDLAGA
eukprot:gnl/TRDRNA2_/TRDRNA2_174730_c1_seq8.p1 gnl/TRDRNA2_/TRDRNA2_174730_c1~~gnl/TRDRNA2_/TRDRNA2_174730_c1_seq8.p1  ORF type:complete len:413 (-),score=68.95 gnl/TRDRNA2_/TRDRNA2_174730_c1_seq8:52-1290(-)